MSKDDKDPKNKKSDYKDPIEKAIQLWHRLPVAVKLPLGFFLVIISILVLWFAFGISMWASSFLMAFSMIGWQVYKHLARKNEEREANRRRIRNEQRKNIPRSSRRRPISNDNTGGHNRSLMEKVDPEKLRSFDDVAGCESVITELREIIDYLKDPKSFEEIGAKIPSGVLLAGDPGTGKTLLAEALAKECGVEFFKTSGSSFVEMFVGTGAARVRDMFNTARRASPSIIFIDEIDAIGGKRGNSATNNEERESTLNQLLQEMDGLGVESGVIIIAATNRFDMLDEALIRAGRFGRHVTVPVPDLNARIAILEVHARGKPMHKEVSLEDVAELVPGFVGADLENLLNEAALLARRAKRKKIKMEDIENAIDRVIAGSERRTLVLSEKELRTVAYHEGGHTLVGLLHRYADSPQKVTIIPRTKGSLGHTFTAPADKYLHSKEELIARIAVMYGGRAAESLKFNIETTGASNDLIKAYETARSMVVELGMGSDPRLRGRSFANSGEGTRAFQLSEEIKQQIDTEIGQILQKAEEEANRLLATYADLLDALAGELLEVETMNRQDLEKLLEEYFSENPEKARIFDPA
ncbi:MAG: AAA family ATPase [Candidatus Spechtbacterales bacterium]|nr:AAA family ATPase [Candidatus Spechtbacterales bacterium]